MLVSWHQLELFLKVFVLLAEFYARDVMPELNFVWIKLVTADVFTLLVNVEHVVRVAV